MVLKKSVTRKPLKIKAEFTLRPWTIDEEWSGNYTHRTRTNIEDEKGCCIATSFHGGNIGNDNEVLANVQLMAMAPAMFQELLHIYVRHSYASTFDILKEALGLNVVTHDQLIELHKQFEDPFLFVRTAKLLEWNRNACKTYYNAAGHGKASRNEARWKYFQRELERRGVPIPSTDELLKEGVFNGEGAD